MASRADITVSDGDRPRLEAVVEDGNSRQRHVWRVQIILARADGRGTMEVQSRTAVSKPTILCRQERSLERDVDGLLPDATGPPGKESDSESKVREVLDLTRSPPPREATRWTLPAMAAEVALGGSTVCLTWRKYGLLPHCFRTVKLSRYSPFAAKVQDVVGPHVKPPENTLVLSTDESEHESGRTHSQALARMQAPLPMKTGQPETHTANYKRHSIPFCGTQHLERHGNLSALSQATSGRTPSLSRLPFSVLPRPDTSLHPRQLLNAQSRNG